MVFEHSVTHARLCEVMPSRASWRTTTHCNSCGTTVWTCTRLDPDVKGRVIVVKSQIVQYNLFFCLHLCKLSSRSLTI